MMVASMNGADPAWKGSAFPLQAGPVILDEEPKLKGKEIQAAPFPYVTLGAARPPCEIERASFADLAMQQYLQDGRLVSNPEFGACLKCVILGIARVRVPLPASVVGGVCD